MRHLYLFFCLWVLSPLVAGADTVVLKSGMRFDSERVWEENDEIKCEARGLVLGFPKKDVLRIEKEDPRSGGQTDAGPLQTRNDAVESTESDLDRKRKELDEEYDALIKELAKLSQEKETRDAGTKPRNHNRAVAKYNERVAAYERRRSAYIAEAKANQERIITENEQTSFATHRLEKLLSSWIDQPIARIIEMWGSPDNISDAPNGNKWYLFVLEITPSNSRSIYLKTDAAGKILGFRPEQAGPANPKTGP